ncbi:B3 domain-containing protein At5g60130-like [Eutrema salsugineum]|uniref:B3 domain-containing protein At5g60130-like n=1 Tax=Eutrema salsugineum TaxID=72664 RepID=UPI000CED6F31|nr:B3 domain-containing protein At5g60130-like [Eutrema salsugineum]
MKKGNSSDDCLPKFFKVYLPGESGDDLEVPVSFNRCLPNSMPKNVIVRSIYGNVWKLELRKCCDGIEKFLMVDGWKRIVKGVDLKGGEFLAFEFDGSRLFNFCIYDQATCKRLGNSVKTREIEDESDGEDDLMIISDDDDDDQDYGDGDDVEAADVEAADVEADDDDDDDDNEDLDVEDDEDDQRRYLDDTDNPSFTVILNPKKKSQLRIPAHVIKDYNLNFPERVTVVDPLVTKFGTMEKIIKVQKNGSVFVKGFGAVYRRNNVKTTDRLICEVKKSGSGLHHKM